jgi:hypothetical protein
MRSKNFALLALCLMLSACGSNKDKNSPISRTSGVGGSGSGSSNSNHHLGQCDITFSAATCADYFYTSYQTLSSYSEEILRSTLRTQCNTSTKGTFYTYSKCDRSSAVGYCTKAIYTNGITVKEIIVFTSPIDENAARSACAKLISTTFSTVEPSEYY